GIEKMIEVDVSFGPTARTSWRTPGSGRRWRSRRRPSWGVEDRREMERLTADLPLEKAASHWIVSDDPDEHVEQIRKYVDSVSCTWSSMGRARTRSGSSGHTGTSSCRGLAPSSARFTLFGVKTRSSR